MGCLKPNNAKQRGQILLRHYFTGKPWHEIVQTLDFTKGNLFAVALLATLIAPWLSAKARGLI